MEQLISFALRGPPPPDAPPGMPHGPPSPPLAPMHPPEPMVAPVSEYQPDALVFLGLSMCIAVPVMKLLTRAEDVAEDDEAEEGYAAMPAWLFAAYASCGIGFAILFFGGAHATSLGAPHSLCVLLGIVFCVRHSQRMGDAPRRPASAALLGIGTAYLIVLFFRLSMRTERCEQTVLVLSAFAALPVWRLHVLQRRERCCSDHRVIGARRRGSLLNLLLIGMLAAQPWLGVCGPVRRWAETTQMTAELTMLGLVTDFIWR